MLAAWRCGACGLGCRNKKQCAKCGTAYCDAKCQKLHWKRGHKADCPAVAVVGVEQFSAAREADAAAAAAERDAEDAPDGACCYVCLDGGAGLARGCACRGAAGFAHVGCLARSAEVDIGDGLDHWHTCRNCRQPYHGAVQLALGRACWRRHASAPPDDRRRAAALNVLGNALTRNGRHAEALPAREAALELCLAHHGDSADAALCARSSLANSLHGCGRADEACALRRSVYGTRARADGGKGPSRPTLAAALDYAISLSELGAFREAQRLLRAVFPAARASLGATDVVTIALGHCLARALTTDDDSVQTDVEEMEVGDVLEAVALMECTHEASRRVYGGAHPTTIDVAAGLDRARNALAVKTSSMLVTSGTGGDNY